MSIVGPTLIENSPIAYEAVFRGELPYEPQPEESDIGLSGLWRAFSRKNGPPGNKLGPILEQISTTVESILTDHEAHSRSNQGDNGEALFSLTDPGTTLPIVTGITSRVMYFWGMGLGRNDYPPLSSSTDLKDGEKSRLANMMDVRSIVIVTAASVMRVLPIYAKKPDKPTQGEREDLARILANWGPQFLVEWLNGTIVNKWLDEKKVSEPERQEWQKVLTEGSLKHFVIHNLLNPLDGLSRAIENYQALTDNAIAERLGWSAEEVVEVFTPSIRKNFAVGHITDPFVAVDKVKNNLEALNTTAIAEHLGWSDEEVAEVFTPGLILEFATRKVGNPYAAMDKVKTNLNTLTDEAIAESLAWTEAEVDALFTPKLRKQLAISNIDNPMDAAKRFVANLNALTDEVIAKRVGWVKKEVKDVFTQGLRREFAIRADPFRLIDKVKINLDTLTDEAIAQRLGWTVKKAGEIFTPTMRRNIAVGNANNIWHAVDRVRINLETLSDQTIAKRLCWSEDKVRKVFHPSKRKYFASHYITDPFSGIVEYVAGNVSYNGKYFNA